MATEDFEGQVRERLAFLEGQVRELIRTREQDLAAARQDAAAARVLAGAADRDVSEIRAEIRDFQAATVSSFNAMREDLTDLRGVVGDLTIEVRGKFDAMAAGQQQIVGLLNAIMERGE